MDAALAAFHNLCALARVDGVVCANEARILAKYQRALGLRREDLRRELDAGSLQLVAHDQITASEAECAHVLAMLVRVAWADGRLTDRERARIQRVAETLDIGPMQLGEILVRGETEARHRDRVHRRMWIGGSVLAAGLSVVAFLSLSNRSGPNDRRRLAELESRLQGLTAEQARRDADSARASWAALSRREAELLQRVEQLERQRPGPTSSTAGLLAAPQAGELRALKLRLDRLTGARSSGFKEIERHFRSSVFLLVVTYELERRNQRVRGWGSGSAFVVSPDGILATSKHVLQPWKFMPELVQRIDAGFAVDQGSVRIVAWPAGSRIKTEAGGWDYAAGYDNRDGGLRVLAVPPDRTVLRTETGRTGLRHRGRYHVRDNTDLALLRIRPRRPLRAFQLLGAAAPVEKLDPVMVLGFPTGTHILEGLVAESSPSVGVVRKVQDTVMVTAPVVAGNSGGPVVDAQGRVIGVATRTYGDASLACCIRAQYLLPLLPNAGELLDAARRMRADRRPADALALLDLAVQRGATAEQLVRIARLRGQCDSRGDGGK
ncbi:MAG: trypsin-like peptidase domain-containing protein [Planctomycetes bacterium]|nr:trypsin-like peptidase domain-containing protein [Planctomycetota bacterium]MCB9868777.1 trypsin-like peptidase domain-containing protein [Planctomycetota bacterium]